MTGTIDLEDDDGEESVTVSLKYKVCPTCEGKGKHVNPSIDGDGLTAARDRGETGAEDAS